MSDYIVETSMASISNTLEAALRIITKQPIQNLIQEIQMSIENEPEIIIEPDQDPSTTTLADLMTTYNQAKEAGSTTQLIELTLTLSKHNYASFQSN